MEEREFEEAWLARLNPHQQQAVRTVDGAVLLLAVPGSGKTTVLITRLGYMVCCRGIDAGSILTMTYTTAATAEMAQRFSSLFPGQAAPTFCTINSLSNRILTTYADYRGRPVPFALLDNQQAYDILSRIHLDVNHEAPTDSTVKDLRNGITYIKNRMLSGEELQDVDCGVERLPEIYSEYCRILRQQGLMDFDDQMAYAHRILKGCPPILEYFQKQFPYLCVDESQDTSKIQHEIIGLLAKKSGNLFMVGDEDQSIYGFRAAYPEALLNFKTDYPGAAILLMEENYRSTKEICAAANAFVSRNRFRYDKTIRPTRPSGQPVQEIHAVNRIAQFQYLFEMAKSCNRDTAILTRNNDSLLPLIDLFERSGIPYNHRRTEDSFFTHRIVTDLTDIIHFAENPRDGEIFLRIYHKLGCSINKSAAVIAVDQSRRTGRTIPEELLRCPDLNSFARETATELMNGLEAMLQGSAEDAIPYIRHTLRYGRYVELHKLDTGKFDILTMLARNEESPLSLLQRLADLDNILKTHCNSPGNQLTLSTVHSSKGLEYDRVYLLDVFDGVLPSIRPADVKTHGDLLRYEEDRRVCYVAMTRAREALYVFTVAGLDSSFLTEILRSLPREALDEEDVFYPLRQNLCGKRFIHRNRGKGRIIAQCGEKLLVEYAPFDTQLLALPDMLAQRDLTVHYTAAPPPEQTPAVPDSEVKFRASGLKPGSHVTHSVYGSGVIQSLTAGIAQEKFVKTEEVRKIVLEDCLKKNLLR